MTYTWNFWLVAFSFLPAIVAAYNALQIASQHPFAQSRSAHYWIITAAIGMGMGIWTLHFIAMLAMHPDDAVAYDAYLTAISLLLAIIFSWVTLALIRQYKLIHKTVLSCAISMTLGVTGLHYVGMAAMKVDPHPTYNTYYVAASILIALFTSAIAFQIVSTVKNRPQGTAIRNRLCAAAVMLGAGVAGLHYTAMAGTQFSGQSRFIPADHSLSAFDIALLVITFSAIVILVTAILINRHNNAAQTKAEMIARLYDTDSSSLQRSCRHGTENLKAPESALSRLLDQLPGMVFRCHHTPDATMDFVSDYAVFLTGYGPQALVNDRIMKYSTLIHDDDRNPRFEQIQQQLNADDRYMVEYRLRSANGDMRWVCEHGTAIYNNMGQITTLEGFVENVHDRRTAHLALQESEVRYRLLAEYSTDLIIRQALTGKFLYVSPASHSILGYKPEELREIHSNDIIHPDDIDALKGAQNRSIENGTPTTTISRCRHRGGSWVWLEWTFRAVADPDTEPSLEIQGSARDVTARIRAEEQMRGHRQILQYIAEQQPLNNILIHICRLITDQLDAYACTISIADKEDNRLSETVGFGLPSDSLGEINANHTALLSVTPAPDQTHKGTVIVDDVSARTLPPRIRATFKRFGIRSCWSVPLRGEHQKLDGVFTAYFSEPRRPSERDHELIEFVTDTARLTFERTKTEDRLRLSNQILDNTVEALVIYNTNREIVAVNKAFTDITGYTFADVGGQTPTIFRSGRHSEEFYQGVHHHIQEHGHWEGEFWRMRKDGTIFPALISISAVRNDAGVITHYVDLFNDISRYKRYEERLEFLAYHDPLTDTPNRALLQTELKERIHLSSSSNSRFVLMFIDIDDFKTINDSLGHEAGDYVLQEAASRMRHALRDSDFVARLGGDEFAILLGDIPDEAAVASIANKILRLFDRPVVYREHSLVVRISIGVSCYPEHGTDSETLLRNADMAMYKAKHVGRNTFRFFSSDMDEAVNKELVLKNELHQAMDRGELYVVYQTIIDIHSRTISGVEALMRWRHPRLGEVAPANFIPIAEETGLILPLGDWILYEACRNAARWRFGHYGEFRVHVNVSLRQLRTSDFVERARRILEEHRLSPDALVLEITETMVMGQSDSVTDTLNRLRAMGVGIVIDDFGTGFSSLGHLKRFPVTGLKIDRSFITDIPNDINDIGICKAIIAMAQSLDLRVVAEGVETEDQWAFLKSVGCDEAQGYLFSYPVVADEVMISEADASMAYSSRAGG